MAQDTYAGNPLLKGAYQPLEYDKETIEDYIRCSKDPVYFAKNYMKIIHVDHGLMPFDLYDYQEEMVETMHNNRFVICKMPRQTGKSTTIVAYLLHFALFNPQSNIAILANKGSTSREILQRLKTAYEHLPKWLQQGVVVWNRGNIELENGSKVISASTSSSAVRGSSFNIIFMDEFAHIDPPKLAEDFFTSVYPTISSGKTTKVFIVSTPKGLNMFYKMWIDAEEKRSNYIPIEVHWSQTPGRDDAWKKETIKNTSELQFAQEYECDFIGSQNTLIAPSKLRTMPYKPPIIKKDCLDVYVEPDPKHSYVCIVDVARGRGQDYSAFSIIDVTQFPYEQVAKYRDPNISPMLLPNVVDNVGKYYNHAYVLVEINDIGGQVADILHYDLEYSNIFQTSVMGRSGQTLGGGFGKSSQLGIRTTKEVKRKGCSSVKDLIEGDKLLIWDLDTITEMTTFIAKGSSYEADEGYHDDLMMTLILFGWLVNQKYFTEITDMDLREKMFKEQLDEAESQLIPFGFINDGRNSYEPETVDMGGEKWVVDTKYSTDYLH
jgi:DNA polymerase III delta prime subunit